MIWFNSLETLSPELSPLKDWLLRPFVLTEHLKKCHTDVHLNLLQQGFHSLSIDDQQYLRINKAEGWQREIFLQNNQTPLTYGQVSMPKITYLTHQQSLDALGANPIGQTLLYNKPNVTRGPFSFAQVTHPHALFIRLQTLYPQPGVHHFWARRSLFLWDNLPLMILEVFFPTLTPYPFEL